MVLDDFFRAPPQPPAANGNSNLDAELASPLDRLAAVIADLVLIVPVITLLLAPFTYRAKEAKILGEDDWFATVVLSGTLVAAAVWVVYQALFTAFYGGSPGKLILRLRVVSVWTGGRPRLREAFWRSVVWVVEGACFLLPFLSVYSNLRRRPFHDRVADTRVIALAGERQAGLAGLAEMALASGFQSASLAMVAFVFGVNFFKYMNEQSATATAALRREDEGRLCPQVREAVEESPSRSKDSTRDRLEVALLLFTAGQLEEECLEQEAEFSLWREGPAAPAYLAKGLVAGARNGSQGIDYLEQACRSAHGSKDPEADVDACRLATLARADLEKKAEVDDAEEKVEQAHAEAEVEAILNGIGERTRGYLIVAAIKRLAQAGEVERALDLLDGLHEVRHLGGFVSQERAQILWRLGRKSESLAAMRTVFDMSDPRARTESARWFCERETDLGGCGDTAQVACRELRRAVERDDGVLERAELALTYIRGERCLENKPDWRMLTEQIPQISGKAYIESLALIDEGESDEAMAKLRTLVEEGVANPSVFHLAARKKLVDLAKTKEELWPLLGSWNKENGGGEAWQSLGRHLLSKLCAMRLWDEAIATGFKLVKVDSADRESYAMLIDAAQGAGNMKMVAGLMARSSGRKPASRPEGRGP